MARIKKDVKQEQALMQIEEGLEEIKAMNAVLSAELPSELTIVLGKGKSGRVTIDGSLVGRVMIVIQNQRQRVVAKVRANAKKYRIDLDDKDEDILLAAGNDEVSITHD